MKPCVKYISCLIIFIISIIPFYAQQITNKQVVAKVKIEDDVNDLIKVIGTATNTEDDIKSLRYELFVIKTNPENNNVSRNKQSGRFVIKSYENRDLSTTTINKNTKDKITILLLIYDTEDKLLGKDRVVVLNDDKPKKELKQSKIGSDRENDGILLRGIVTDNTKTKSGRDFYRAFYSEYLLSKVNAKQIINIEEGISLGRNTDIIITVDNTEINRFRAQPRPDFIRQMVGVTFQALSQYLQNIEKQKERIVQY